jgi:hypothetical protein
MECFSQGYRQHTEVVLFQECFESRKTILIGAFAQTDKHDILGLKHIASVERGWCGNLVDMLIQGKHLSDRRDLASPRFCSGPGHDGSIPDDNRRVFDKGAVRIAFIRRKSDKLETHLGESLAVSFVLETSQWKVNPLRILLGLDAPVKAVRDLSDESESMGAI